MEHQRDRAFAANVFLVVLSKEILFTVEITTASGESETFDFWVPKGGYANL